MARHFIAALFAIVASAAPARAQTAQCIDPTFSWTTPFIGSLQAATYYTNLSVLGLVFTNQTVQIYPSVPLSVANGLQALNNQDADNYYATRIRGRYLQALLAESTSCPLLAESTKQYLTAEVP